MKFSQLGLSEALLRSVQTLGYETTTPIQAEAIPKILSGQDLVGCAQTGTGKTAAFALPLLDRLLKSSAARVKGSATGKLRALVLVPTRELAAQVTESLEKYGQFTSLRQSVVYGGVSQQSQVRALQRGVDTLVATPGRLLDLMEQGYVDLSAIEVLVFDEADQMLDLGFLPALKRIVGKVPSQRQTLMFSATMPNAVRQLAQQWLDEPAEIQCNSVGRPADGITQSVHFVDQRQKPEFLTRFLKQTPQSRTLVFVRTKHGVDKVVKYLERAGVSAAGIHGNKSQNVRTRTLARFKSKSPPVLVATDVAARGLNVEDVSHVVNFDLPDTPETYVHRIGRTARAGSAGVAVSFCDVEERRLLQQIERLTRLSIPVEPVISGFEPTQPASESNRNQSFRPRANRKPPRKSSRTGGRVSSEQSSSNRAHQSKPSRAGDASRPPRKGRGHRVVKTNR